MNKNFLLIGILAIIVIAGLSIFAFSGDSSSDYVVEDTPDGGKKLVNYTGNDSEVNIPDELKITVIGQGAFTDTDVRKVKSNTVKDVEEFAFYGKNNLTTIDFPNIETIGDYAFCECEKLSSFLANPNLKSIGKNAFTKGEILTPEELSLDIGKYLGFKSIKKDYVLANNVVVHEYVYEKI